MLRRTAVASTIVTLSLALSGCSFSLFSGALLSLGEGQDTRRLEHAVAINDENPHAWFLLGKAHLADKEFDDARDAFGKALKLQPELDEAQLGLGVSYLEEGNWRSAAREYEKLVARRADIAASWEGLAVARLGLGKLDSANDAAKKAVEIDAASPTGHRVLGEVAYIRGEYQLAIIEWEAAAEDGSTAATLQPMINDLRQYVDKYISPSPMAAVEEEMLPVTKPSEPQDPFTTE